MAARHQYLIILLAVFTALPLLSGGQEKTLNARQFDSLSLSQFNQSQWKSLIGTGKEALRNGYDYYYLRMRMGLAGFARKNFLQAALHFKQALAFNEADPVATEYLFLCLLELNRAQEADRLYRSMPGNLREKLADLKPLLRSVDVSAGYIASDQPEQFDYIDLDGEQNYYGETDLTTGGIDFNAGLNWMWPEGYSAYAGFTHLHIRKNKQASIGDTMAVDDQYHISQDQFYVSGGVPLGRKGLSVSPAFNLVLDNYRVVEPQYNAESGLYSFPVVTKRLQAMIAYLELAKDFRIVKTSVFGAWSNLNEKTQYQAGFHLLAYPLGNLNFYLSSKLLNHSNNGFDQIIFEQMVGARLFRPLWTELSATFGEMRNYHENNAFVVYNFADDLKFKAGGKLIWVPGRRWKITAEYLFLLREGNYITYQDAGTAEDPAVLPITFSESFSNHLILIALNWKF